MKKGHCELCPEGMQRHNTTLHLWLCRILYIPLLICFILSLERAAWVCPAMLKHAQLPLVPLAASESELIKGAVAESSNEVSVQAFFYGQCHPCRLHQHCTEERQEREACPLHQPRAVAADSPLYDWPHNTKAKAEDQTYHMIQYQGLLPFKPKQDCTCICGLHERRRLPPPPAWVDADYRHLLYVALCSHQQCLIA